MTNKNAEKQAIHPVLNFENLKSLYKEIILLNPEERSKMKGLDPQRADLILSGSTVAFKVMKILVRGLYHL